ncbi:MAG TPA: hypothetical protein VLF68_01060, partial [Candidatus Saccharimonadales bacterium]|nr:hypothetical protein [Candidatus Saccharimonadales bacterium]
MQKRLIIILSILIVFLGILLWYLQEKRPQGNQAAQKSIASLTHTVIGKTTAGEIEKRPSVIKKESLGNNQTKYFLDRNKNLPYDEITTKDNVVVLERDIVPENPSDAGYTTVSDFLRDFGTPDKIIRGSKKY